VDLKCVNPANGPSYYRECLAKVGEKRQLAQADANRLRVGDRVSVCLDAEVLKAMAQGHGGWIDDMAQVRQLCVPTSPAPFLFVLVFLFFYCLWCLLRILQKSILKKLNPERQLSG